MRHGSQLELRAGRIARVVDRTGCMWAELTWRGDQLVRLVVPGAVVDGARIDDPLLGAAHAIASQRGEPSEPRAGAPARGGDAATAVSALAWARPDEIPTIAAPGRLAAGAGGAILNAIALLAEHAGVAALRYAGPYPTPALWRALARSFRTGADEAAFTGELIARAARLARDPLPIDFAPAPHERIAIRGGHVELRDGLERATIDGVVYARGGSPARLVGPTGLPRRDELANLGLPRPDGGARAGEPAALAPRDEVGIPGPPRPAGELPRVGHHCEIWFGDAPYARIATLAEDGALVDGPHPPPACTSAVVGAVFPPALAGAIAELAAEAVPAPLADDVRRLIAGRPLRWADLGARAARIDGGGGALHAALWDRIAPLGLGRLALALAEALAPVASAAIVAELTRDRR